MHLDSIAVKQGDAVKAGQQLGISGNTGQMEFRGKTGKQIEEKTDKKGKPFLSFSAFSAEKTQDGFEYIWVRFIRFDHEREAWLQPGTKISAKGELDVSVYNDRLNFSCKVSEISEYIPQPYNP